MPLLRPRVPRRPRPRPARLGRRRRDDGRGGAPRAALPRGERDRGGHARGAEPAARLRAARPPDRARRLLLLARRCDRGALGRRGVPRRRLARRARRPEHAGDLAVRERVGDAAADGDRRRRRAAARTSPSSAPAISIRPRSSSSSRRASRRARARSSVRSTAPTPSTSRSTATRSTRASSPCSCPSRTGSGSARSRSCSRDLASRDAASPGSASPVSSATPRTSRSSRVSPRAAALAAVLQPRAGEPGLRSHDVRNRHGSTSRSSTSRRPSRRPRSIPNTCPELRLALPRRRAGREPARLHAVRPSLPGAGARADRAARGQGQLRRGGGRPPLGRPARLLRPARLQRAARRGGGRDRARRRARRRRARRSRTCPASWR